MTESGEQLKPFGELQGRLDAEFEEYTSRLLTGMRKELQEVAKIGFWKEEEIEPEVEKRRRELAEMDPYGRAGELLNNFYFWWPSGYYRELLAKRKIKNDEDQEKKAAAERLIKDLDEVIRERGYEAMAQSVAKKEGDREARLKILADVFIRMRDKGYTRAELTK